MSVATGMPSRIALPSRVPPEVAGELTHTTLVARKQLARTLVVHHFTR